MKLLILLPFISLVLCQDGPVRDTIYGSVRGSTQTDDNGLTYEEYLGIPFASPPINDLRWEKPIPPEPWDGVIDTTVFGPHCTHFLASSYPAIGVSNETSEDCLYLNVYIPGEDRIGDDLTVMYYMYGGGFTAGAGALYPGYDLALAGDVIVVTINYRLSTLGWLSTEDEVAPGNYGLWDAQMGLLWVKDNIAAFGGNPDSVTIFGQSAGAAITSHLMISPPAYGLFQRGIAISGGASGYIGYAQPGAVVDSTLTLARVLECKVLNSTEEVMDCLREKDAEDLDFWGIVSVIAFKQHQPNWMPCIDGDIVPENPWDRWHNGSAAAEFDFISGTTHHEAAGFITRNSLGYNPDINSSLTINETTLNTTLTFNTNHYPGDTDAMLDAIYTEYPLMMDEDLEIRTQATIEAMTDWWFKTPAHTETIHHARASTQNTYLYDYRYDQSFLQHSFDFIEGSHSDDLYSVFGEPFFEVFRDDFLGADFSEEDLEVHDYVTAYYTNFAKTGNPNNGLPVPTEWLPITEAATSYLEISQTPVLLNETEEMHDKYRFWNHQFADIAIPPETMETEYISLVEQLTDEEFEEALDDAIELLKNWMYITLDQFPEVLNQKLNFIETAVEKRQSVKEI